MAKGPLCNPSIVMRKAKLHFRGAAQHLRARLQRLYLYIVGPRMFGLVNDCMSHSCAAVRRRVRAGMLPRRWLRGCLAVIQMLVVGGAIVRIVVHGGPFVLRDTREHGSRVLRTRGMHVRRHRCRVRMVRAARQVDRAPRRVDVDARIRHLNEQHKGQRQFTVKSVTCLHVCVCVVVVCVCICVG